MNDVLAPRQKRLSIDGRQPQAEIPRAASS
jgi:hypothetical protein